MGHAESYHPCSRISRRVMAEQHIHLAHRRPGYIGIICTDLYLPDAVRFAAQRTKQVAAAPHGPRRDG
jgi:[3-methyl-2-oxobutanoate dehydrogenase (acetyl-transferring)] kinase